MRTVLIAAIAAIAVVLSATPYAQAQAQKSQLVLMRIPDSKKDAEIHISKLLLEKLSVNTSLHSPKDKPDDMVVRASFDASEEQGTPAIVMLIDTKIVQRNKEGKPLAQVISISSFADVKVHDDKKGDILAWVNNLNRQLVPMRVYLAGNKVGIGRNLLNGTRFPLSENAILFAFRQVLRSWTTLFADMKKREFVDS